MMMLTKGAARGLAATLVLCGLFACAKKPDELTASAKTGAVVATPVAQAAASSESCAACLAKTRCAELPLCDALSGDERANCEAVEKCVETSNCADGKGTFTDCFCGPLKMSECVAAPTSGSGAPAGACAAVIRTSLGGAEASNREILSRFTLSRFAGGNAIARMNCSKTKGCSSACGF